MPQLSSSSNAGADIQDPRRDDFAEALAGLPTQWQLLKVNLGAQRHDESRHAGLIGERQADDLARNDLVFVGLVHDHLRAARLSEKLIDAPQGEDRTLTGGNIKVASRHEVVVAKDGVFQFKGIRASAG